MTLHPVPPLTKFSCSESFINGGTDIFLINQKSKALSETKNRKRFNSCIDYGATKKISCGMIAWNSKTEAIPQIIPKNIPTTTSVR